MSNTNINQKYTKYENFMWYLKKLDTIEILIEFDHIYMEHTIKIYFKTPLFGDNIKTMCHIRNYTDLDSEIFMIMGMLHRIDTVVLQKYQNGIILNKNLPFKYMKNCEKKWMKMVN